VEGPWYPVVRLLGAEPQIPQMSKGARFQRVRRIVFEEEHDRAYCELKFTRLALVYILTLTSLTPNFDHQQISTAFVKGAWDPRGGRAQRRGDDG